LKALLWSKKRQSKAEVILASAIANTIAVVLLNEKKTSMQIAATIYPTSPCSKFSVKNLEFPQPFTQPAHVQQTIPC
jgi:hypothetical protein